MSVERKLSGDPQFDTSAERRSPDHHGDTGATVSVGEHEVAKSHLRRSSFENEVANLRRLHDAGFRHVPELLRVDDDAQSFTMERVTRWSDLTPEHRSALLPAVGQAIARLHELEVPEPDPMPLADALRARVRAATHRLSGWQSQYREQLFEELRSVDFDDVFDGVSRVICHRDFRPQNWGYRERRDEIAFFDWEHSRPDFAATDFARLHSDLDVGQVSEILCGYAGARDEPSEPLRRVAALMHILQTWAWAEQHDDDSYREEVRELSERRSLWESDR